MKKQEETMGTSLSSASVLLFFRVALIQPAGHKKTVLDVF
jgi:hypothetical protein